MDQVKEVMWHYIVSICLAQHKLIKHSTVGTSQADLFYFVCSSTKSIND